jgi:putative ABC transport system permease protein
VNAFVRVARWCVARASVPGDRAALVQDLDEEYASLARELGTLRSTAWYVSQAARSVPALVKYRIQQARPLAIGRVTLWRDLRYGAHALRRAPAFTLVASATLAVGIGASTAAFTAFSAALLTPLPYPHHDRLAVVVETRRGDEISDAYPDFLDWRGRTRSFEALASYRGLTVTVTGNGEPERVRGQIVNANLFEVLGVRPLLGRAFDASHDNPGAPRAALVGYGFWQRRFGGDPSIVGRTMTIDGAPCEVLGILPRGVDFPSGMVFAPAELYLSFGTYVDDDLRNRGSHPGLEVVGLLRPGVSLAQAGDDLAGIAAQIAAEHPDTNRDTSTRVYDAISVIVGDFKVQLRILIVASVVLLLIACANVASLTLTRTMARSRELAVRTALGASRGRLAWALLVEHAVLAGAGVAAGVLLAYGLTAAVRPLVTNLPRLGDLRPDARALGFAVAAMSITTVLFSVAPMLWLRRAPMDPWLRTRGQAARGWRTRQTLVALQVALALTLVVGAMLLGASLARMQSRSGGIVADGTLTFALRLPETSYAQPAALPFFEELYRRLRTGPGVTAVGGISTLPFSGSSANSGIRLPGQQDEASVRTDVAVVTPEYFRAMGITLVRGRWFDARDAEASASVTVIDERLAARLFPGGDALGRRVQGWGLADAEIIGIVGHVDAYGVGVPSRPELYVPLTQRPRPMMTTVVRTTADPSSVPTFVRTTLSGLDPNLAISNVRTMNEWVGLTVAVPMLLATLSAGFGLVALLLAGIGVHGMIGYAVELRRREAGIRLALGARPGAVVRLMIAGASAALAGGAIVGALGAIVAGRLLQAQLFEIGPSDPVVLALAAGTLLGVGLLASWLPARRAARVPLSAVLQED